MYDIEQFVWNRIAIICIVGDNDLFVHDTSLLLTGIG